MLNRIIHSQEAVDLQRVLSEKNLEEEKKLAEKFITEQEVNEYIRMHPNDLIGQFGKLLIKYQQSRPLHEWDMQKMMELSDVTAPFIDSIKEFTPDVKVKAELDEMTGIDATITITFPHDEIIIIWGKSHEQFKKIVQIADGFNVTPLTSGEIELSFDFSDVKKPVA